ncbi:hypothetical protein Tco_1521147, partial [Tanacetum coccineum]
MEGGLNSSNGRGEEAKTWDEMYSIDLMPSELFLKFREQIHGYRLGLNLEYDCGSPVLQCPGERVPGKAGFEAFIS